MTIYLARHGQTDWNKDKRFQSRNNIPLNQNGEQQAKDIRDLFLAKGIHFDYVFSSPLDRAALTSQIISQREAHNVHLDKRLLEVDLGDYEGHFEHELEARIGEPFELWRQKIFIEQAPNGETFQVVCNRVKVFLEEHIKPILERGNNENILIVGHQGVNVALQAVMSLSDKPPFDIGLHQYKQHNDQVNVWDLNGVVGDCLRNLRWSDTIKL